MTRVLVLGRTGMAGHMVYHVLSRSGQVEVAGTDRSTPSSSSFFDASNAEAGLRAFWHRKGSYRYIINCIGLTKTAIDERDPRSVERAIRINAILPHQLASFAGEVSARVIHLSTDGVFSGRAGLYPEDAPHDCLDAYGKTKSLGEVFAPEVLTFRCSIIGPDPARHQGLLEWFLGLPDGKEITGYTDYLWNGVTTLQFAELCRRIIVEDRFGSLWDESPVHHFCPNRAVSKYELLRLFVDIFTRHVVVSPGPTPGGPVTRRLVSRHRGLAEMFGLDREMITSLEHLALEMRQLS